MERKGKSVIYTLALLLTATVLIGVTTIVNEDKMPTGRFTDADKPTPSQDASSKEVQIEKVYWDFGSRTVEGRIAKHNFSKGTHNVTVTLLKSNGENETHEGQIKVR